MHPQPHGHHMASASHIPHDAPQDLNLHLLGKIPSIPGFSVLPKELGIQLKKGGAVFFEAKKGQQRCRVKKSIISQINN